MNMSRDEAAHALSGIKDARQRANGMKRLPWTYHVAVGALMGSWVALQGLSHWWFGMGLLAMLGGAAAIHLWQREATGRWINGFRWGWTLPVAMLMLLLFVGFLLTSNPALLPNLALFTPLQAGIATFFAATFLDWLWVKAYDREMRGNR
jgi:small-conductance mechanosensitive channel